MLTLPHCQIGDKQEWTDNRDYVITEFTTRVNFYKLLGEMWWNVGETQEVLLYSLLNDNIAHIAVQLQHNDKFSNSVCCIDCINCTAVDGWKKCTEGMAVATELYRNGATVALSAVQYSDRLLFYFSP